MCDALNIFLLLKISREQLEGGIFEVLVVWLIVASGEGGRHLLPGQRTAVVRARTTGRRSVHASFRAPRFVPPIQFFLSLFFFFFFF